MSAIERIINKYLGQFVFKVKSLNFRDNNGMSEIMRNERSKLIPKYRYGLEKTVVDSMTLLSWINGSALTNIALAGTGKP